MIEFLPAFAVGTDCEYTVLFELGNCSLHLSKREPGRLSDVILAGGVPPSMLLAVFTNQRADSVHYVFV
jgi:hypothetical protein